MTQPLDTCRLDYLVGTLATAYKGVITSLVLRDFCITGKGQAAVIKGTILSMPQGRYVACLMHVGAELKRAPIENGFFEIETNAQLINNAANLQIDIVQEGRHIGTFLLKKEKSDGFFAPAFQLSEELRDLDLTLLTSGVRDKPGLNDSAERLISLVLSSKRDWKALSENINSFSKDLFWSERNAFYKCFDIFIRFSLSAAEASPDGVSRQITNFISLIELPLEQEEDITRVETTVNAWQQAVIGSSVDLSKALNSSKRLANSLRQRVPGTDISPLLQKLLRSLETRLTRVAVISAMTLDELKKFSSTEDIDRLIKFSDVKKTELIGVLSEAATMIDQHSTDKAVEIILNLDQEIFNDVELINTLFDVVDNGLTAVSAIPLLTILLETVLTFIGLSSEAQKRSSLNLANTVGRLSELNLVSPLRMLITRIASDYPLMVDSVLLNNKVGEAIAATGDNDLIGLYTDILPTIIVTSPNISRFSSDTWAEIVDPLHLERLSKLLHIIGLDSKRFSGVLTHLICNIYITGVFIPDDKLFQREVSAYLNSGALRDNFLPGYILLKRLPVYFNEVGATGRLRDYTTEIDSWGNDVILYFLRKQIHANASNFNVRLIEQIIKAWTYDDPGLLKDCIPEDVIRRTDRGLITAYSGVFRPLLEACGALSEQGPLFNKILDITEDEIKDKIGNIVLSDELKRKIILICMIYREVRKKYSSYIQSPENTDYYAELVRLVEKCASLKQIVVAPGKTEAQESLYYKRHIAFGIPSVMGSYHEPKFDALGEMYRSEEAIRTILEGLAAEVESAASDITENDLIKWIRCLGPLNDLFLLHDRENFQVDEVLAILFTNELRVSQIIDLLRIWQKELLAIVESFYRIFGGPITRMLKSFSSNGLPDRLKGLTNDTDGPSDRATDIIFRDIISSVIGVTELDRLLSGLMDALRRFSAGGDHALSLADESLGVQSCYLSGELTDVQVMRMAPFLGSKAKNLFYLENAGLNVPPFAVLSARARSDDNFFKDERFDLCLKAAVRHIEAKSGRLFGDPTNPLFLSVRSGSYISMPGILSTILYCGMNEDTLSGLVKSSGDKRLGWDSYRRFIKSFASAVFDMDEEFFDKIAAGTLTPEGQYKYEREIKKIVYAYLETLEKKGLHIPSDVNDQLRMSVQAIYRTWQKKRPLRFREAMGISDHWGTSVSLVEMVSGNASGSGASVFFTRIPFTDKSGIYGETREQATGDDLVQGKMLNRPISVSQTSAGLKSLEETDPDLYLLHKETARLVEKAMRGMPQEVEATYIRGDNNERTIYILQTKRMEVHQGLTFRFDDICEMAPRTIGRGVGVYGGALSGVASLSDSLEALKILGEKSNRPVILLRSTANTDDASLMPAIDGIITSMGGPTSHAAVLTQKFNLTAVVGCSDMVIEKKDGVMTACFGEHIIREGDEISLDGSSGLVYLGSCPFTVRE